MDKITTTIKINASSPRYRSTIDRNITYYTNQYGGRIHKRTIHDYTNINYIVHIYDSDTYIKYGRALSNKLNTLLCAYSIERDNIRITHASNPKKIHKFFEYDEDDKYDPDYVYESNESDESDEDYTDNDESESSEYDSEDVDTDEADKSNSYSDGQYSESDDDCY